MSSQVKFDVVVIGGGPGGYVAAIRAAQLGMRTALIERSNLGGVCLNWGCIPTKALLRAGEIYHNMKNAAEFGLVCDNVRFDMSKIVERSRNVAQQLSKGVDGLMKSNGIEVLKGHAVLNGAKEILLHEYNDGVIGGVLSKVHSEHVILATGARPRQIPNLNIDNVRVLDYMAAMTQTTLPKSLLVIGGGAIGVEFASFYASLGSEVTLIELGSRILMSEDEEISNMASQAYDKQGIKIYTNATLSEYDDVSAKINVDGKSITISCEKIISAVGVTPNTEGLGLDSTKISTLQSGHLKVNEYGETDENGIYAIGDITKPPYLAHKASHEGVLCVENIYAAKMNQKKHKLPVSEEIPGCIYSHPEIASIGISEVEAKSMKSKINVGKFPLIGNGKAIAVGDNAHQGMIKTICDEETGEILGVHMIGHGVTEMIHSVAIAKKAELTDEDLIHTIFPHPTISEALHESALATLGRELHMPKKAARQKNAK